MAKSDFNEQDGVWRTVGGRRIFIRTGQSLADAMVKSGKFKSLRSTYRKEKQKEQEEDWEKQKSRMEKGDFQSKDEENAWKYAKKETDAIINDNKENKNEIVDYRHQLTQEQVDYYNNLSPNEVYELGMQLESAPINDQRGINIREDARKLLNRIDRQNKKGEGYSEKSTEELRELIKSSRDMLEKTPKESNWREQVKANNEQLEKDLEEYKNTHDMRYDNDGYYELFRENERKNAKIKQELPDEKYEPLEAYATYKEKREKLEPRTEDGGWKDSTWTGKEYTNDEFMENLEDENWHTERKMLLDAGLTNKQMEFVKNNTEFHNGSPSLDKEIVEELIKGAKGEKYRTPKEIKTTRKNNEIERLSKDLETASKNGTSGMSASYNDLKERYKNLTGKEFDDSNVKIPYDSKKEYKDRAGNVINQDLIKDHLAGFSANEVKNRIESEKNFLMNYKPEDREINNAYIKEMEKYYNNMEKYDSRISDDFSTSDWKEGYGNQFGEGSWKGSKSNSGLYGKDKIKAIDDEIKKAYPEITTSRKTHQGGYTDSFSLSVMSSTKPIVRDISDFSDSEIQRLYNKGYNSSRYANVDEFKKAIERDLNSGHFNVNEYNIDDDYRLTPFGKQLFHDINKVSNAYNYDESASQVDYFNTGHYMSLSVGKDGKPYQTTGTSSKSGDWVRDAFNKYKEEHPGTKKTFAAFKKENEDKE